MYVVHYLPEGQSHIPQVRLPVPLQTSEYSTWCVERRGKERGRREKERGREREGERERERGGGKGREKGREGRRGRRGKSEMK